MDFIEKRGGQYVEKCFFLGLLLAECFFLVQSSYPYQRITKPVPGELAKQIVSNRDSAQRYAVYLPQAYSREKRWPVVFIMDPRGRALLALRLFRRGADELGYILLSSYNTRSDGPEIPNVDALNAMINDALQNYMVDTTRFYLAGFSGTARLAWPYGYQLNPYVAGVIGFGAGMTNNMLLSVTVKMQGYAFSYFGGAAYFDFNYFELYKLDEELNELTYPHSVLFYKGVHSWPDSTIARQSLYWMEIRAMKERMVRVDTGVVGRYEREQLRAAMQLEKQGDLYEAYRRYKMAQEICEGLVDIEMLKHQVERLQKNKEVKKAGKSIAGGAKEASDYVGHMSTYFDDIRSSEEVPGLDLMRRDLSIDRLMSSANADKDPYRARTSRVMLENAYVRLSFYEPRYYLEMNKPTWALSMLLLANQIKPDAPQNCFYLARTYVELNQKDDAFGALECLEKQHVLSLEMLNEDPYLRRLDDDPRMSKLKENVESGRF